MQILNYKLLVKQKSPLYLEFIMQKCNENLKKLIKFNKLA